MHIPLISRCKIVFRRLSSSCLCFFNQHVEARISSSPAKNPSNFRACLDNIRTCYLIIIFSRNFTVASSSNQVPFTSVIVGLESRFGFICICMILPTLCRKLCMGFLRFYPHRASWYGRLG
jgi:hypothetical protein